MTINTLYELMNDPDSYWIVYDLNLTNGWADSSNNTLPIELCTRCGSWSGHVFFSHANRYPSTVATYNYNNIFNASSLGILKHSSNYVILNAQ